MLKGSYTAIFVSVFVHVILLLALFFGANKTEKIAKANKPEVQVIKSFLYKAPKKVPPKKVTPKIVADDKVVAEIKYSTEIIVKKLAPAVVTPTPIIANEKSSKAPKETPRQVTNAVKSDFNTTTNKVLGTNRGIFSSYDRLSRLRQKLDKQQRDKAFADLTQQRSVSAMDGEQFPVPESIIPLTREQKYIQNTSKSHVGTITKNDNGTCTIYREQILGSPVEATTSTFACGESKFDKGFREHMQKVQAKLGH